MPTSADLERALAAAGSTAPVRWDEVTGSTNATALEMAAGGAPEWALVAAGHQTAGRGRLGRAWQDRPGRALMFSVVLRPPLPPEDAGLLPLLAGTVMAEVATEVSPAQIRCKWPNDLLIGDQKVAGTLGESVVEGGAIRHVVIGIGVNLDAPEDVPGSGALGPMVDPMDLLTRFLVGFQVAYTPVESGFAAATVERWSAVSATLGRRVEAARRDGETVRGLAVGLDPHGGLIVQTSEGPATVAFGEVVHLR
jgi:BirA family biotin operon repressor/biotin-[acetyl-CoA-carboxylase] ligase